MSIATATREDGVRTYAGPVPDDLVAMLAATAARAGGKTAFVDARSDITWSALAQDVEALAGRLAARGVRAGDRVALLFGNGIPFVVALWGAWRAGAIVVPLNSRLLVSELVGLVQDAEPVLLLAGATLAAEARELASSTGLPLELEDGEGRLLAGEPAAEIAPRPPATDEPAAIMYTSGTTGQAKGVVVTHGNFLQNARTCIDVIGRGPDDVELVCVPQFNITGLGSQTIPVVFAGMTGVLVPRFDTGLVLEAIAARRATTMVGAPTMWWRLLEDERFATTDTGSLRLVLFGGAPMPTALLDRLRAAFPDAGFGNGYGMTETCSMVTYLGGDDVFAHPASVGRPLPITDVRVVDPDTGEDVPEGVPGELWFRGPQVCAGYWRNPEATAAALQDGWMRTGDAGVLEEGGFLVLRDRLKDVIKRGGESIYCIEVENVLHQHPAVLEAAVVGIPDDIYGERVKAVVACKPGRETSEDELREFCRSHLARFKVPSIVEFVTELPRNAGGKVLKAQLRRSESSTSPILGEGEHN